MQRKRLALLVTALALAAAAGGCGSTGNALLGFNSHAAVSLVSRDIRDLTLIVSPRQGTADQPSACTQDNTGFGCDRLTTSDTTTLSFTTDEDASTSPYYVYIRNAAAATRTATLQITMDGDSKVNQTFDVPASTTVRVARVFRNSADTQ